MPARSEYLRNISSLLADADCVCPVKRILFSLIDKKNLLTNLDYVIKNKNGNLTL